MFANLEALAALAKEGTMSRAALVLKISQSAVSKRIHSLEDELGRTLLEARGRRVHLTPFACRLLETSQPLNSHPLTS